MKWISVKDKLPESDGDYIVSITYSTKSWSCSGRFKKGSFTPSWTTHWMEYPPPANQLKGVIGKPEISSNTTETTNPIHTRIINPVIPTAL